MAGELHSGAPDPPRTADANPALKSLSKHGLQACCMWSPEEGFYHFSDNWTQITGLLPGDCMGTRWSDHWHDYTKTVFDQAVQDLFSGDPAEYVESITVEGEMIRGEGAWATMQLSLLATGTVSSPKLTILVTDMTEHREMQHAMLIAERQSQMIAHGRSSFLSNMSHELRTPLNAILGFVQMLQANPNMPPDKSEEYLKYIRESGDQLLTKISDLIEIANIDSGNCKLRDEPLNLADVIQAAVEMHSHTAFQRDITLRQETNHPHLVIRADRAKFMHCLTHLMSNAIRHSDDGGLITISYHGSSRDGVVLSVQDQGSGIPKERLNNIRATLHSERSYFQTDIENIGIGLATTKELIELHGGKLSIESIARRGTVASLKLPASRLISLSARVKPKGLRA